MSDPNDFSQRPDMELLVELPERVVAFSESPDGEIHVVLKGGATFPLKSVMPPDEDGKLSA